MVPASLCVVDETTGGVCRPVEKPFSPRKPVFEIYLISREEENQKLAAAITSTLSSLN